MATTISLNMDLFRQQLVTRTVAAGYTPAQLKAAHTAFVAGTESGAQLNQLIPILCASLFAALQVENENTGPAPATYLEHPDGTLEQKA